MKGQADLAGILRRMYSDVMGQAKILLAAPDITADQFRKFNAAYHSVLEEARQRQPDLYDEFHQNSEETITGLRVKARAHAIEVVQDITTLFSSLSSYVGGHEIIPEVGRAVLERKAPALLEQRQPELQALDIDAIVSQYEINPKYAGKLAELMGTYAPAKVISEMAGITTSGFYFRIKKEKKRVQTDGVGGYMLDETTIPIFFREKTPTESHAGTKQLLRSQGNYMSVIEIRDRFGYTNVASVYQKLKENRRHFQQKREGRRVSYLVTDINSRYLIKQRHQRPLSQNTPEPSSIDRQIKTSPTNSGDILTFTGMVDFAREKLGREGEDWVVQMISEHGDTLQKKHNQFSRARLEELLAQREHS